MTHVGRMTHISIDQLRQFAIVSQRFLNARGSKEVSKSAIQFGM